MEDKLNIMTMKKKDFEKIPLKDWNEEVIVDNVIIVPSRVKHDSGYLCMSFVGCVGNEPVIRTANCSDVLHIDGTGGYGDWWKGINSKIPESIKPKGWKIDCLPCGLLRIFCTSYKIKLGHGLSDFDIIAIDPKAK